MRTTLKKTLIAGLLALGAFSAVPAAQADSIELRLGTGLDVFALSAEEWHRSDEWRDDDDSRGHWRDDDDGRDWRARRAHRSCTPDRALDKAEDMGFRRVSIERVGRETIRVSGRRWGERHLIVFARERNCPVLRIR